MVGRDGIVVFVAPGNKVHTLSAEEVSKIFAGEITDWSALGGDPAKINIYSAGDKSGTFQTFRSLVLRPYKRELAAGALRVPSNAQLAKDVADDPGGIGFASFAEIGVAKPIRIRDSCGLIHMPSEFAVKSGAYSLSRYLYFYTTDLDNSDAAAFINYATSLRAADAVREAGFIDSSVTSAPFETFRDRIANSLSAPPEDFNMDLMRKLMNELGSGERLSVTLHFESLIANLDSQSIQQLANAVIFLQKRGLKGRKLILAGFSDAMGPFEQNMELSLKRATAARDALIAASTGELKPEDVEVRGYGELLPIACNDTEAERLKNRRVELWLVPADQPGPVVMNKHR
jgi:phosphate transport system substrate-binding protein